MAAEALASSAASTSVDVSASVEKREVGDGDAGVDNEASEIRRRRLQKLESCEPATASVGGEDEKANDS